MKPVELKPLKGWSSHPAEETASSAWLLSNQSWPVRFCDSQWQCVGKCHSNQRSKEIWSFRSCYQGVVPRCSIGEGSRRLGPVFVNQAQCWGLCVLQADITSSESLVSCVKRCLQAPNSRRTIVQHGAPNGQSRCARILNYVLGGAPEYLITILM